MSAAEKMSLEEATNIGHQLLVMGKLSMTQFEHAQARDREYRRRGVTIRFGAICKELGFCTEADLDAAERAQHQARDTRPDNDREISEAFKIVRQVASVNEKSTTSRLRALESASLNGHGK